MKARVPAIPAAVGAVLISAIAFAVPANAATNYEFKSYAAMTWCAQENGTTTGVYLDPCASNSSDYWYTVATVTSAGVSTEEIRNVHSQLCLTGEANGVVDLKSCNGGDAQDWAAGYCDASVGGYIFFNENDADPGFLWQSNKSLQLRSTQDDASAHDCWAFFTA